MKIEGRSKRRKERRPTSIPGKANYFIEGAHTAEDIRIINITLQGAGALISCPLKIGQMINLKFAMPQELRCYDMYAKLYEIWGVVRFVGLAPGQEDQEDRYETGVAFTGKTPPSEYLAKPDTLFDLKPVPRRDGLWSIRPAPRFSNW